MTASLPSMTDAARLGGDAFTTAAVYVIDANWDRRTVRLVNMTRESYKSSLFLDWPRIASSASSWDVSLNEVIAATQLLPPNDPLHFIFHTGFSGSTLLSRHLDVLSSCLVLREPHFIAQLAARSRNLETTALLNAGVRLLARRFKNQSCVVVKANDLCCRIAGNLLEANPCATATVLTISLPGFLIHALRSGERRHWSQRRAALARMDMVHPPAVLCAPLTAARAAAWWWSMSHGYMALLRHRFPERVTEIDAETVIDDPVGAAKTVVCACAAEVAPSEWVDCRHIASEYAKRPEIPYSAALRRRHRAIIEAFIREEIEDAIEWAEQRQPEFRAMCVAQPENGGASQPPCHPSTTPIVSTSQETS